MKRSSIGRGDKPLERKTPLKRTELNALAKWLTRSSKAGRRNRPLGYRVRDTGPDRETRDLVLRRDGGRCVMCGTDRDLQCHHRIPRGMGSSKRPGINQPQNLLTLCAEDHRCVESSRTLAYENGWLVRRHEDPASKAVLTTRGWVLLTPDGRAVPADEPRSSNQHGRETHT